MKRMLIATALTALGLTGATQADAKIDSLGECYDAVITWCNEKHPNWADICASNGMDECDQIFKAKGNSQESGPVIKRLRLLVRRAGDAVPDYGWQVELDLVATPPDGDDDDHDRGARDPEDTPPGKPDPDDEPRPGRGGPGDPTGGGRGDGGGDTTDPTGRGG